MSFLMAFIIGLGIGFCLCLLVNKVDEGDDNGPKGYA